MDRSSAEKEFKKFAAKLKEDFEQGKGIVHEGTQIKLPVDMTIPDAMKALKKHYDSMEEETSKDIQLVGHPSESLVAIKRAMDVVFGDVWGKSHMTFFGLQPGQQRSIDIGYNEKINVPFGLLDIPGLPIQFNIMEDHRRSGMNGLIILNASFKKMYESVVDLIEVEIQKQIKENSIFQGKAIDSKFNFINLQGYPLDRIVYTSQEYADINSHIFRLIRSHDWAKKHHMPMKRTILLHGKFGTGKTLTALLAANISNENGFTFMNVVPGDDITQPLNFAKKYQPAMVFFEDIDQVAGDERTSAVNTILNTIDGLLSKSSRVMTVLTTNNADKIQSAMLRPGRIDAVIELGDIDETSIIRLIRANIEKDVLVDDLDPAMLLEAAEKYTPSFVVEACSRATLYALERTANGGNGHAPQITNEDLVLALRGLRSQFELMENALNSGNRCEISMDKSVEKSVEKSVVKNLDDFADKLRMHQGDDGKFHFSLEEKKAA